MNEIKQFKKKLERERDGDKGRMVFISKMREA